MPPALESCADVGDIHCFVQQFRPYGTGWKWAKVLRQVNIFRTDVCIPLRRNVGAFQLPGPENAPVVRLIGARRKNRRSALRKSSTPRPDSPQSAPPEQVRFPYPHRAPPTACAEDHHCRRVPSNHSASGQIPCKDSTYIPIPNQL
jgi:hypothetical protein